MSDKKTISLKQGVEKTKKVAKEVYEHEVDVTGLDKAIKVGINWLQQQLQKLKPKKDTVDAEFTVRELGEYTSERR